MAIQTKLEHLTNRDLFSNYYLENLLPESDTWKSVDEDELEETYQEIKELYEKKKESFDYYNEAQLEDNFIKPIFEILDLSYEVQEKVSRRRRFPDYGIFENQKAVDEAIQNKGDKDFYRNAISIADAKRWERNLDKRGGVRDFSNPSHQIFVYLQETPVDWGILTNGREWRLYYSKTSHKLDSYLEIDLPTILEKDDLQAFKYFYIFFRKEAFVEDKRERSFLDKIYDQSNLFSQELGENLKANIYEAIRLLSEGFLEFPDNDLDSEDDLDLIHDSSLIYLYRLIFVLYAESEGRDLLDTGNRIYHEDYSLNSLKQEVCDELEETDPKYKKWQSSLWDRLEKLFLLIDKGSKNRGIPEEELYVPAYNGGLFRTEVDEETSRENEFLQENKVGDSYLAEVIDLLTRHESQNGEGRVFVDYSSLDIRHLGSIYEGLLEYNLNVAPEKMVAVKEGDEEKWYSKEDYDGGETIIEELDQGEIYLTTDKGERKATGSYYTPEYIVQYIVENTLDPILDEIREDLLREGEGNFAHDFAERVFELKVLDPAMGSGHFLTNAVDHLAREIVNAHEKQAEEEGAETVDESHDIHWARRQVAQKCIYGVDLNSMAVELAKVSLWLRTLAAQQPLAFLDHHLKTGNSLIGSDIEDIEELDSSGKKEDVGNATLEDFGMTWKGTMEDLMSIYQDFIKIENQELSDIKEMEEKYHKFEHEPIKERLEAMANVHTAREFGVDVPEGAFSSMAEAIDDEPRWAEIEGEDWFEEAQKLAGDREFFHWKLAFPEVFYDEEGGKKEDSGFDVVIGNPPYFNLETTEGTPFNDYLRNEYEDIFSGKADVLYFFIDRGETLFKKGGSLSYIVSRYFTEAYNAKDFREKISQRNHIDKIVDFGNNQVFPGVDTLTIILKIDKDNKKDETNIIQISDDLRSKASEIREALIGIETGRETDVATKYNVPSDTFGRERWLLLPKSVRKIKEKMCSQGTRLGTFSRTGQGMMTGLNEAFTLTKSEIEEWEIEQEVLKPLVKNGDLRPYLYKGNEKKLIYLENKDISNYPSTKEYLEQFRDDLSNRAKAENIKWYRYQNPINKDLFEDLDEKVICPFIATDNRFYLDKKGLYNDGGDIEIIFQKDKLLTNESLVALCNSRLLEFYHLNHAKLKRDGFYEYFGNSLRDLPIHVTPQSISDVFAEKIQESAGTLPDTTHEALTALSNKMADLKKKYNKLNLNLLDYLGNYVEGMDLPDIGFFQPSSTNILDATTKDYEKLRIGNVKTECKDKGVTIYAKARYKPKDESKFETDQWGYIETDYRKAFSLTNLSEQETKLVESFVPTAVEKGEGFADFRENATKTNSLIDRLKAIKLPHLDNVSNDLERYIETREFANELAEKIMETDHTIDAIVFDLYDLTEEEVEGVLDSLDTDEEEMVDIMGKFRDIKRGNKNR